MLIEYVYGLMLRFGLTTGAMQLKRMFGGTHKLNAHIHDVLLKLPEESHVRIKESMLSGINKEVTIRNSTWQIVNEFSKHDNRINVDELTEGQYKYLCISILSCIGRVWREI